MNQLMLAGQEGIRLADLEIVSSETDVEQATEAAHQPPVDPSNSHRRRKRH
jgi:hypothetical protein